MPSRGCTVANQERAKAGKLAVSSFSKWDRDACRARVGEEAARRRGALMAGQWGYQLAEQRKRLGFTQAGLAEIMGVTPGRVSQIEHGEVSGPHPGRRSRVEELWAPDRRTGRGRLRPTTDVPLTAAATQLLISRDTRVQTTHGRTVTAARLP